MHGNFHRDCAHYDSVVKEPRPVSKHKGQLFISCMDCGYGMLYYCDSDFENIRTECKHFVPKEPCLEDFISLDGKE